jgi:hypothetical protein
MSAAKSASGAVESVPDVATLILATLTGAVGYVPNPESEASHGQTFSVEDPHGQPRAASGNADAELRLRSATVGRSRQTTGLPDLDAEGRRHPRALGFRLAKGRHPPR